MLDYNHSSRKFDIKSKKLKLLGFDTGGYRLLDVEKRKVHLLRKVEFNEVSIENNVTEQLEDIIVQENNVHNDQINSCFIIYYSKFMSSELC